MVFGMVLMFVLETGTLVALAVWLGRRVVLHLKDNPAAVSALSEHLWVPLLGKTAETPPPPKETDRPPERIFENSPLADSR